MSTEPVTSESLYFNRRALLKAGLLAASATATGAVYRSLNPRPSAPVKTTALDVIKPLDTSPNTGFRAAESPSSFEAITHYNNFYEFTTDKNDVCNKVSDFRIGDWKIEIGGLVSRPQTLGLDDFKKIAPAEERIYRMRCVETWSMVIPWAGFSLSQLLKKVEPLSSAKYVAFETLYDPNRFPAHARGDTLDWPYVEGLRLDEAMHPLTILATGIYGRTLPVQDGAPVRLVVPWKYGFKGIKSIAKITLTEKEPPTTWHLANPPAYGFYANVNPEVSRPWSQATEKRLTSVSKSEDVPTQKFNGYEAQVAHLYKGMDLEKYY